MNRGLFAYSRSETIFNRICSLCVEYRYPILGSVIAGMLAYTFAFTNKLVNLDDLYYMFSKGATIESGRWGLELMSFLFPDYSMPWIYGILSLVLITIGICICVRMFSIEYLIEYCNGITLNWATNEEIAQIRDSAEFDGMTVYPNYGCVKVIDDVFVIKLSDNLDE